MAEKYLTVTNVTRKRIARLFGNIKIDPAVKFNGIPCWIWLGFIPKDGYGRTGWGHNHKVLVHRLMYAWLVEPLACDSRRNNNRYVPNLDHLCRRRACCNPAHLELVSQKINNLRGNGPCARNARKSHCPKGHALTPDNVYTRPSKSYGRECKTCRRTLGYNLSIAKRGQRCY